MRIVVVAGEGERLEERIADQGSRRGDVAPAASLSHAP
jgi:hypothetical protein